MSFDRRWLEDSGSEDSHGRTLWALASVRTATLVHRGGGGRPACLPKRYDRGELSLATRVGIYTAWVGRLLCAVPKDSLAECVRTLLADRLIAILSLVETKDWVWFEDGLAYDNARLPQALIITGFLPEHPPMSRPA